MALILLRFAFLPELETEEKFVIQTISGAMLACSVVTLLLSQGKHPGWIAFLVIAILSWMRGR